MGAVTTVVSLCPTNNNNNVRHSSGCIKPSRSSNRLLPTLTDPFAGFSFPALNMPNVKGPDTVQSFDGRNQL